MASTSYPSSPAPSPKGALPKSSQKGREFLRQTDDDKGPMLIEQFIYRRDRYRSSSTAFPFPLPMRLENLPPYLQSELTPSPAVRQEIMESLREHQIQAFNIGVYGQSKVSYPNGGDKVVPALYIDVDAAEGDNLESWSAARRDISNILEHRGYLNLEVEIQDPQRFYKPSLFAIHPTHAAVGVYKAARIELLTQIFNTIGMVWRMLSLFEVGRTAKARKPTVVLMVEPLATHDWKMLIGSLEAVLDKYRGNLPKLSVEVMPGAVNPTPPQSETKEQAKGLPGLPFIHDFNTHPRNGTSIGVQGEIGGGTLGGFFKMVAPSRTHIGFLTNSHVVAPPTNAPSSERSHYNIMGLPYHGSGGAGTRIHYFAANDVKATKKAGKKAIQVAEDIIQEQMDKEKQRSDRGRANEQTRSMLRNLIRTQEQNIQRFKENIAQTKEMPQLYGRTILASGRALNNKYMTLDYAFVETSAVGNQKLPDHAAFGGLKVLPSNLGLSNTFQVPTQSQHFNTIEPGKWYFKVGRTTGITSGICNGVEAWVKPENQHTLYGPKGAVKEVRRSGKILETNKDGRLVYDENGKPKEKAGHYAYYYASEWIIINASVDRESMKDQQTFSAPGDSGSLIVDQAGGVAGILWGELTGFCGPTMEVHHPYVGAGLVTCIEDVKEAMKLALGWPADANVEVLQFP